MASPGPSPPSPGPFRGQPPPSSRGQPSPGPGPNPNRRGPFPPSLSPGSGPNNPIQNQPPPGSRAPPLTPTPTHAMNRSIQQHEPDTKTGGEAGMAGVGRRGFAAAARAALFTNAMGGGSMGMQDRRGPFLDMDAAIAISSAGPLSSPSPVSPRPPFSTSPPSTLNAMPVPSTPSLAAGSSSTGISSGAETFFDKFRNRIPGLGLGPGSDYDPSSPGGDIPTAKGEGNGSATPRAAPSRQDSNASETSISSSSTSALTLGLSYSKSNASASSSKSKATSRRRTTIRKSSVHDDSEDSDYGGLAYADSTDDEDIKSRLSVKSGVSRRTAGNSREGATPIPGQTKGSALASSERPISGSVYSDDDDDNDLRNRLQLESSPPAKAALNRMNSNSSISSASSASSSAAAIAKALGLSKSNAEEYSVLGGPGAPGVARTPSGKSVNQAVRNRNRSATVSSSKSLRSNGSLGSGRARSGTEGSGGSRIGLTELEQAMQGLLGDVIGTPPKPRPVGIGLRDDGPSSPPHSPVTPPFFDSGSSTRGSKLAHRSNTVGVTTPYTLLTDAAEKMPKLPARSMTERGSKALHVNGYHSTSSNHEHDNGTKKKVKVGLRMEGGFLSMGPVGMVLDAMVREEIGGKEGCFVRGVGRICTFPSVADVISPSKSKLCRLPTDSSRENITKTASIASLATNPSQIKSSTSMTVDLSANTITMKPMNRFAPLRHAVSIQSISPASGLVIPNATYDSMGSTGKLDGRMLCEKHANRSGEDWEDESWNDERASGAQKRMTRFIDLGALGDLR
ncbi:hypothetical protein BT96DRAFT_931708 [Gymnopus androsaceus JB14]|uniref:Uncharacterized protein n=1 Tax=Gymnopus androsaceus JB14 TaxID=1447944 RepID=A0A6A4IHQ0_9AGAR|nr:hypothetical protein BT96DRAFT_931708 [Gymnopus androsaceus JB14]